MKMKKTNEILLIHFINVIILFALFTVFIFFIYLLPVIFTLLNPIELYTYVRDTFIRNKLKRNIYSFF